MPEPTDPPLPTTRTYSGWGLDPALLARGAEQWLRERGYEVRAAGSGDTHLVQARIVETGWKSWFSKCPSLDVRVAGGPHRFTIGFGDGTWGLDPVGGGAGVGRAVGKVLTAIWVGTGAHRRQAVESEFWQAVGSGCRSCGVLGRTESLERTVTGTSRSVGKVREDGTLPGLEGYRENFRCSACDHTWTGEEQTRAVALCPGCERPCEPVSAGETAVGSVLIGESSPGVSVGDVTFVQNHHCPGCSHAWHGQETTRRAVVCPACVKPIGGEEVRRDVTGAVTRTEVLVSRDEHYQESGGLFTPPERVGYTYREHPVQVQYEISVGVFQCEHCSHEWTGLEEERRIG